MLKSNVFICIQTRFRLWTQTFPSVENQMWVFWLNSMNLVTRPQPDSCNDHWFLTEPGWLIHTTWGMNLGQPKAERDLLKVWWEKSPPHCLSALVATCWQGKRRFHDETCSPADCLAPWFQQLWIITLWYRIDGENGLYYKETTAILKTVSRK